MNTTRRYGLVARTFHWLMAALILLAWSLGYYASTLDGQTDKARLFTTVFIHKSIGVTVLFLFVLRFAWRLTSTPPPLPQSMPSALRLGALGGHYLLYTLMLLVPLSGMAKSSASGWGTSAYGLFTIPPMFAKESAAAAIFGGIHDWLVWVFLVVVLGHIAMALKHLFIDKDEIFASMGFGRRHESEFNP